MLERIKGIKAALRGGKRLRKGSYVTRQIIDYLEVIVMLVLAPMILSYWTVFRDNVGQEFRGILDAMTVVLVMGIAATVVGKLTQ